MHNIDKIITTNITLKKRSESYYTFNYDTQFKNKLDFVKTCAYFTLMSLCSNITNEFIDNFNSQLFGTKLESFNTTQHFTDTITLYHQQDFSKNKSRMDKFIASIYTYQN